MLTNYNIINEKYLSKNNNIKKKKNGELISIEFLYIKYLNKDYDLSIIEIQNNNDLEILEIDDILYQNEPELYYNFESIYIIYYNKDNSNENNVTYGILNDIYNNELICSCNINSNNYRYPIFNLSNNKIIGLFINNSKYYNKGIFFKYIINEIIKEFKDTKRGCNEIDIQFEVDEHMINKKMYFLDNYDNNNNFKGLNELNAEIYLIYDKNVNKEEDFKNFFIPDKKGRYTIKLKFKCNLIDCSYMFAGCKNIKNIKFIRFNTKNVTNMKYIFYKCEKLKNINLFSFETKKVIDLSYMFYQCSNLINLDLSSFDTQNVTDMSFIFFNCWKLYNLDLSNFIKNNDAITHNMSNGDYFKENPQYLKFKYTLTTKSSNARYLFNFEVFIGLKDRKEYIIYQNKYNNNLDIMDIYDKKIIISLKGNNNQINVLRYFIKDTNEDFLLSCDEFKWIIIWDIQNNYNIKYKLKSENYSAGCIIYDALLLFNIFNKDYILLSNDSINEYSELYEFTDNTPFIKNIDNTNNNMTKFLILWIYNNKYYIIECCWGKISINNIFENENYASLSLKNRGNHFSGFLYNDNYLCVGDYLYDNITIWDLVNKTIYKQIKYYDKW